MFEVRSEELKRLNHLQLPMVLKKLLLIEASRQGLDFNKVEVSENPYAGDGGIDGYFYARDKIVGFQVKAKNMEPSECKNEMIGRNGFLKSSIQKVIDNKGKYYLFYSYSANCLMREARIKSIREGIEEGIRNYYISQREPNCNLKAREYAQRALIEIYDADKIANWVNQHIAVITYIWFCLGRTLPAGMVDIETWAKNKGFKNTNYVQENQLAEIKEKLISKSLKKGSVARMSGLAGLGKSRLAYETFAKNISKIANSSVVYIDANYNSGEIEHSLTAWIHQKRDIKGIIIIDNCDGNLHRQLATFINPENTSIVLITIGHEKVDDNDFVLQKLTNETIEKIIIGYCPEIEKTVVQRIVKVSQGFPNYACLLLTEDLPQLNLNNSNLSDLSLVERLLWGGIKQNKKALDVILACSLFSSIGVEGEVETQYQFVAQNVCQMDPNIFYKLARRFFFKRGLLTSIGRYFIITPEPLAWQLAATWWYECHPTRALNLVKQLYTSTDSSLSTLKTAFAERLTKVHSPEVRLFIISLLSEEGVFSDELTFMHYLQLLPYLADIEPTATLNIVKKVLTNNNGCKINHEMLFLLTLQKLFFKSETTDNAFKLLQDEGYIKEEEDYLRLFGGYLVKNINIDLNINIKLSILEELAISDSLSGCAARKTIVHDFAKATVGEISFYKDTLSRIVESYNKFWPEALIAVCVKSHITSNNELLRLMKEKLSPKNTRDALSLYVSSYYNILNHFPKETDYEILSKLTSLVKSVIKNFAKQCSANLSWLNEIEVIYIGSQSGGEIFGETLVSVLQPHQMDQFITSSLNAITKLRECYSLNQIDISVLTSVIKKSKIEIAKDIVRKVQDNKHLRFILFSILSISDLELKEHNKTLFELAQDPDCPCEIAETLVKRYRLNDFKDHQEAIKSLNNFKPNSDTKKFFVLHFIKKCVDFKFTPQTNFLISDLNQAIKKFILRIQWDVFSSLPASGIECWIHIVIRSLELSSQRTISSSITGSEISDHIIKIFGITIVSKMNQIYASFGNLVNILIKSDEEFIYNLVSNMMSENITKKENALKFCKINLQVFFGSGVFIDKFLPQLHDKYGEAFVKLVVANFSLFAKDNKWNALANHIFKNFYFKKYLDLINLNDYNFSPEILSELFEPLKDAEAPDLREWALAQCKDLNKIIVIKKHRQEEEELEHLQLGESSAKRICTANRR